MGNDLNDGDLVAAVAGLPLAQLRDFAFLVKTHADSLEASGRHRMAAVFRSLDCFEHAAAVRALRRCDTEDLTDMGRMLENALTRPGSPRQQAPFRALSHLVRAVQAEHEEAAVQQAAERARRARPLGPRSVAIVTYVRQRPEGVTAGEVESQFGENARANLSRLATAGLLSRVHRGRYTVSALLSNETSSVA